MPDKQQSIILGGIVAGILSTSSLGFLNFLCCMGIIIGALVAVWHYTDTHELTIPSGTGATIGVMVGIVAVVISFVLNLILIKAGINHETAVNEFILNTWGDSMPPEQIEGIESQMNAEKGIVEYVLGIGIGLVFSSVFGAIGGGIGAKMFKKGGDNPTDFDTIDAL